MKAKELLDALYEAARAKGVSVRKETLPRGASAGGLCVLRGTPTVFVDAGASVDAQIEVIARALRAMAWDEIPLDPAVRAVIDGTRGVGRARRATSERLTSDDGGPTNGASGRD